MWNYRESFDITEYHSFVYIITRLSDDETLPKFYIGKKDFFTKNHKGVYVDSDWKEYYGSSKWLQKVITKEGRGNFTREIIHLSKTANESKLIEAKEQLKNHVLTKRFSNGVKQFYNMNILGEFKEDFFTEDEWIEIMSVENKMNPFNRMWITNGDVSVSKLIDANSEIENGWRKGHHYGVKYCWVNNGEIDKKIPRCDINSIENIDWLPGRIYNPTRGKIAVMKQNNIKYINEDELEYFLGLGWTKKGLSKTIKERKKIYVCNDKLKTQKLISKDESSNFLKNHVGWRIGQFKRDNFTTSKRVFAIDMITNEKVEVTPEEYKNNPNLTSLKTTKVKVKKGEHIVFEGYLPNFFSEFKVPQNPFKKALRNDIKQIIIKKGRNSYLTSENWFIEKIKG